MKKEDVLPQQPLSSTDEHAVRLAKVESMQAAGTPAWPQARAVTASNQEVIEKYQEDNALSYQVAGRVMTIRAHGKTVFATLQDWSTRLQIYIREDVVGEAAFKKWQDVVNTGDIVWAAGTSFKTKTGEVTLRVTDFALLSKSLYPMPEKFHGLTDTEICYRQRYLDLISSGESRNRFMARSKITQAMRHFFENHGFIEVETPMLHAIPGGAAARPFVTHHNALDNDFYLRIAPELFLKRLVVGGFERVYEIGRVFRNEGISTRHNPEFTMVEWYIAHHDYHFMMDFTEQMIRACALAANKSYTATFHGHALDFEQPFVRLNMYDAVKQYGAYSDAQLQGSAIDVVLRECGLEVTADMSWGTKLYSLFEKKVESKLIQPTFITHFPIEVSPLAKRDEQNPAIAARYELFIAGMEISNGFNELNDPFDQASRFHDQVKARTEGDAEAHHYDADYVHALEYALPPTVGAGIGVDRLVMLLTDAPSIRDVILFPTLKKKDL